MYTRWLTSPSTAKARCDEPSASAGGLSYRSPAHRHCKTQNIYAVDDDGKRLLVHDPAMTEAIHRRIEKAVTSVAVDGQVVRKVRTS